MLKPRLSGQTRLLNRSIRFLAPSLVFALAAVYCVWLKPEKVMGAVITWTGGAFLSTSWNNPNNWSTLTVPGPNDLVVFNSTSTRNCDSNATISVAGIRIQTGYTGTISLLAPDVASLAANVGSLGYQQNDGAFSSGRVAVSGPFTIAGGTCTDFTSTVSSLSISGDYSQTGGTADVINLDVQGNFTQTGGTFTDSPPNCGFCIGGGGLVEGNFTLSGGTFNAPNISGGSLTSFEVRGDFTHTSGGIFNNRGGEVTFSGGAATINVNGGETFFDLDFFANDGVTKTIASGDTLVTTGTLFLVDGKIGTGTVNVTGTIDHRASFDGGSGTISITPCAFGCSPALGTLNGGGHLPFVNLASQNFTFNAGTAGTVILDGGLLFQSGTINQGALGFTFNGGYTQTGGTFNGGSGNIAANGGFSVSSFFGSNPAFKSTTNTLSVTGNFSFSGGTFNTNGGTITFNGSATQTPDLPSGFAFSSLTINNPAGVMLNTNSAVAGTLTLTNGTLSMGLNTLTIAPSGTVNRTSGHVIGNLLKNFGGASTKTFEVGTASGYTPVVVQVTAGSGSFAVKANQGPQPNIASPTRALQRYWTLTATGMTASLTFNYLQTDVPATADENAFVIVKHDASGFSFPGGAVNTAANTATINGVGSFSDWTLAEPSAPTLVELMNFTASETAEGRVLLAWQTGFEVDNLGFRIYRDEAGNRALLNQEIVAGSALTAAGFGTALTAGREYAYWVDPKDARKDSAYWLEDIGLDGTSTWHGPFYARQIGGKPPAHSQAESLSQVGRTSDADATHALERFAPLKLAQSGSSTVSLQQESLASSRAVKIAVRQAGWHRISQAELINAGLDPKIDPRTLRLFVDGIELPIFVAGEEDGRFDASDSIEFYGVALNTPSTDTRVYWLIGGSQPGLRIKKTPFAGGYPAGESFPYAVERRDRTIYFSALRNGDEENFFGAVIAGSAVDHRLTLNDLASSAQEMAVIEVSLEGVTTSSHQVSVGLNSSPIGRVFLNGQTKGQEKIEVSQAMLREGENVVTLQSMNGPSDISLVDSIRITYQHSYRAETDALSFTAKGGQTTTINGFSSKGVRVFDVTDERDVQELGASIDQTKDGYAASVTTSAAGDRKLLALTEGKVLQATNIKANTPSHLRDAVNVADFIIISDARLIDSLKPLVDLRTKQGLVTAVVDIEDIYDEFSFGNKSPQSIKDFLSYAAKTWKLRPRFVLFAGDASYDARNYLGFGENDLVPTKLIDTAYLETASDDWLVDFDDDGIADLSIGRLPVRTPLEASTVVDKLVAYEKSSSSNEVALVADSNDGFDFEQASTSLRWLIPSSLRVSEIFRSRTDDAAARNQLLDAINRGQKIVNYSGHGSVNVWRGNLLTAADGQLLTNKDHLSLFVMMTCLNGYFQDAMNDSLGESLLKAETGGAVAVWASSALCLPEQQTVMNQELYRLLFSGSRVSTLGELMRDAKGAVSDADIRRSWILLGDPTMRVK